MYAPIRGAAAAYVYLLLDSPKTSPKTTGAGSGAAYEAPMDARAEDVLAALVEADGAVGTGRFDRARELLQRAQSLEGEAPRLIRLALDADAHARRGRAQPALAACREIEEAALPLPGVLSASARFLMRKGLFERALVCAGRAELCRGRFPGGLAAAPARAAAHPELLRPMLTASGLDNLPLQMQLKEALLARFALGDAAVAYAAMFSELGDARLVQRPLRGLCDYASGAASFFEQWCAPQTLRLPYSRVFGAGDAGTFEASGRALFVAALNEATVVSRSSLICVPDAILFDHQGDELQQMPPAFSCDGQGFAEQQGGLAVIQFGKPWLEIDEAVCLFGAGTRAFGHWIGEFLGKLFQIERLGVAPGVPVLIDAGMPPTHRQALEFYTRGQRRVVEVPPLRTVRVQKLWTASTISYAPFYPRSGTPMVTECLCAPTAAVAELLAAQPQAPADAPLPKRLFLRRGPKLRRKLTNQDELEAICRLHGFVALELECLAFTRQLSLVQQATHLVGPAGSALLFAFLYAAPGAKILNLHPPALEETPSLTSLADARGVDVTVALGECVKLDAKFPGNSDFTVRAEVVLRTLHEWGLAAPPEPLSEPIPQA